MMPTDEKHSNRRVERRRRDSKTNPYGADGGDAATPTEDALNEAAGPPPTTPTAPSSRRPALAPGEALGLARGTSQSVRGGTLRPTTEPSYLDVATKFPPKPHVNARSGHIWPPSGRKLLDHVPWDEAKRIDEPTVPGLESRRQAFRAGPWRLEAQPAKSDESVKGAHGELARRARVYVCLGSPLSSDVALYLALDDDDSPWIWTISPWSPSIAWSLHEAYDQGATDRMDELLIAYATACALALRFLADHGLGLSYRTRNFVVDDGGAPRICEVGFGLEPDDVVSPLLEPAQVFADMDETIHAYGTVLVSRLAILTRAQHSKLGLLNALRSSRFDGVVAQNLRERLMSALQDAA